MEWECSPSTVLKLPFTVSEADTDWKSSEADDKSAWKLSFFVLFQLWRFVLLISNVHKWTQCIDHCSTRWWANLHSSRFRDHISYELKGIHPSASMSKSFVLKILRMARRPTPLGLSCLADTLRLRQHPKPKVEVGKSVFRLHTLPFLIIKNVRLHTASAGAFQRHYTTNQRCSHPAVPPSPNPP